MPYRIDHQICFSKTLWFVYNWLDGVPKLSFQFVRKSTLQEVLSPSSCRDLSTSCRRRYFPSIKYLKSNDLSAELLKMSSDSLSKRHIDPSSNVTWNETISRVRSAPAMQKYNRHWTCSMYVFPSGLSSLIYSCYHLQLSVSILLLKQTQESERNRHIEIEALLAAVSSQRVQEPNPSNTSMLLLEYQPALYCLGAMLLYLFYVVFYQLFFS